jgi:Mg2+-importing ATPase
MNNLCFMGTSVISGTATAVVLATGSRTYFGAMARGLIGRRVSTRFERGVTTVSRLMIQLTLTMVPIVFLINVLTKGNWTSAFLFSISVAVGLMPEILPMIVSANLARGAVAMSRKKVIVKRLDAIQNLGAMDVLCTDKTGTLTQDKVELLRHLDINGEEDERVFEYAFLNSDFQTGLKNLLDEAVLEHEDLLESKQLTDRYLKYDEIPSTSAGGGCRSSCTRSSAAGTCSSAREQSRKSSRRTGPSASGTGSLHCPRPFAGGRSSSAPG